MGISHCLSKFVGFSFHNLRQLQFQSLFSVRFVSETFDILLTYFITYVRRKTHSKAKTKQKQIKPTTITGAGIRKEKKRVQKLI